MTERFITEPNALWRRVIQEKYGYEIHFTPSSLATPVKGGLWRNICSAMLNNEISRSIVLSKVRKKVGSGAHTRFWLDLWVGDCTIKVLCPRLFLLSSLLNGMVSSFGFLGWLQMGMVPWAEKMFAPSWLWRAVVSPHHRPASLFRA